MAGGDMGIMKGKLALYTHTSTGYNRTSCENRMGQGTAMTHDQVKKMKEIRELLRAGATRRELATLGYKWNAVQTQAALLRLTGWESLNFRSGGPVAVDTLFHMNGAQ